MSVIFVVTPVIVGGWPVLTACAAAAAASLGYKQLKGVQAVEVPTDLSVALDASNLGDVGAGMRGDQTLQFGNAGLRISVAKDARGKLSVHVGGEGRTQAELQELGQEFLNKVLQQYAYQRVAKELKQKGYQIVEEGVEQNRNIRIRFRKFE